MDITSIVTIALLGILCVMMMAMTTICIALAVRLASPANPTAPQLSEQSVEQADVMLERLNRQVANIMAYDGTDANQKSIDRDGDDV